MPSTIASQNRLLKSGPVSTNVEILVSAFGAPEAEQTLPLPGESRSACFARSYAIRLQLNIHVTRSPTPATARTSTRRNSCNATIAFPARRSSEPRGGGRPAATSPELLQLVKPSRSPPPHRGPRIGP